MKSDAIRAIAGLLAAIGWSAIAAWSEPDELIFRLAAYSVLLSSLAFAFDRVVLVRLFRPRLSSLAIGIGCGIAMAAATHAIYAATAALIPGVRAPVFALYSVLHQGLTGATAAFALCLVVVAEEVIWRGLVLEVRGKMAVRVALAAGIYAVAQLGVGEPLLVVLGLGCGVIWSVERLMRDDLIAPLATHLVWDLLILVLFPLEHQTSSISVSAAMYGT